MIATWHCTIIVRWFAEQFHSLKCPTRKDTGHIQTRFRAAPSCLLSWILLRVIYLISARWRKQTVCSCAVKVEAIQLTSGGLSDPSGFLVRGKGAKCQLIKGWPALERKHRQPSKFSGKVKMQPRCGQACHHQHSYSHVRAISTCQSVHCARVFGAWQQYRVIPHRRNTKTWHNLPKFWIKSATLLCWGIVLICEILDSLVETIHICEYLKITMRCQKQSSCFCPSTNTSSWQ